MKAIYTVGIDLSKDWFDYALLTSEGIWGATGRHQNTLAGMRKMVAEVRKAIGESLGEVLFCCEHTGLYGRYMEALAASEEGLNLWVAHPAEVHKCAGVVRGKSDSVDAMRIAEYASRYQNKARLWKPQSRELVELQNLSSLRQMLLKTYHQIMVPINELKEFDPALASQRLKACSHSLGALKKELAALDNQIDKMASRSAELGKNYELLKSVRGVGPQTAIAFLVATQNFTIMCDARKLACYSGIAPFDYQSGKSIKGRKRVSHFADKTLKAILHMAAMAAIRSDQEIKAYFARKAQEGKNKMAVINAVRFKILSRMVAVIKRGTPFIVKENLVPQA